MSARFFEGQLIASMNRQGKCHENAIAESFLQLLKRKWNRRKFTPRDRLLVVICSITSRCFTTRSVAMISAISCPR